MGLKTISLRELSKQASDDLVDIWNKKRRDKLIKYFYDHSINVLDIENWEWLADGCAVIDGYIVIGYDEDGTDLFTYAHCPKCDQRSDEQHYFDDDIEYYFNAIYDQYKWMDAHLEKNHKEQSNSE